MQVDVTSVIASYWYKPVGGYDHTFVETLQERLKCKICNLACRKAQISTCCGCIFCKVCLDKLKELVEAKSPGAMYGCPHCLMFEFHTFAHTEGDQQIKKLKIYCPNKNKGCQWTGMLNDIHKHIIDGKCQDVAIECENFKGIIGNTTDTLKSHPADYPGYCQYCNITAGKEEIILVDTRTGKNNVLCHLTVKNLKRIINLIILIGLLIIIMLGWQCLWHFEFI